MNFTLSTYKLLCSTLVENYYTILTVNEFLATHPRPKKSVVLRHDVDRQPSKALRMARLEHHNGLKATYYFRFMKDVFDEAIIKEIFLLGHEVGYHYETLSKARGNMDEAISLFEKELEAFRNVCPVHTASMHGRPLSPWDNRELWKFTRPEQFHLTGECYMSIDYDTIQYFSDTGRTWHPGKYNIRDHVHKSGTNVQISSTEDLILYLQNNKINSVCISTHPNRWSHGAFELMVSAGQDFAINQIKKILLLLRNT